MTETLLWLHTTVEKSAVGKQVALFQTNVLGSIRVCTRGVLKVL